MKYRSLCIR